MLTVNKLIAQGRGLSRVLLQRSAGIVLDWDVRQKSRFDATDSLGRSVGVSLPHGSVVRGGDVLVADDGSLIVVAAAPQPVMVITHCKTHGSAFDLARAAYHLGRRHVALELQPDHLKLEPDHALANMLRQMHLTVTETEGPAVDALIQSAEVVEGSVNDASPPELRDAFSAWVDGARLAAEAISRQASPKEFNQIIDELNDARSTALGLCDATYR